MLTNGDGGELMHLIDRWCCQKSADRHRTKVFFFFCGFVKVHETNFTEAVRKLPQKNTDFFSLLFRFVWIAVNFDDSAKNLNLITNLPI